MAGRSADAPPAPPTLDRSDLPFPSHLRSTASARLTEPRDDTSERRRLILVTVATVRPHFGAGNLHFLQIWPVRAD